MIEGVHGTLCGVVERASGEDADNCRGEPGAPFETLTLPEPEPEPPSAEQTPADGDLSDWFRILGWEWPW